MDPHDFVPSATHPTFCGFNLHVDDDHHPHALCSRLADHVDHRHDYVTPAPDDTDCGQLVRFTDGSTGRCSAPENSTRHGTTITDAVEAGRDTATRNDRLHDFQMDPDAPVTKRAEDDVCICAKPRNWALHTHAMYGGPACAALVRSLAHGGDLAECGAGPGAVLHAVGSWAYYRPIGPINAGPTTDSPPNTRPVELAEQVVAEDRAIDSAREITAGIRAKPKHPLDRMMAGLPPIDFLAPPPIEIADPELRAMAAIIDALEGLDGDVVRRVLRWVCARNGLESLY